LILQSPLRVMFQIRCFNGFCGVRGAARLVLVPDVERTRAVVDMVAYFSCCKLLIQW
jgi:hypothetical protein